MIDNAYHEVRTYSGQKIIIDLADLNSAALESGAGFYSRPRYEVMVFYDGGPEIESFRTGDFNEAVAAYRQYLDKYPDGTPAPLTGKYLQLRNALVVALGAAKQAADGVDDGGACCVEGVSIALPRWRMDLVKRAAEEAGAGCFEWNFCGKKRVVFLPRVQGQAHKREVAAEAMVDALNRAGYSALVYSQMD